MTCDPRTELQTFVDLTIAPAVGPEVIAGSTRLKAGTATKLVLNMLTTGAMVRIGKTYGNLMVDLHTSSEKARDRARRIISMVTGLDDEQADTLLNKARWNVKAAIVMQKTKGGYAQATARLRKAHDSVREAIGEDIEPRLRELLHLDPDDSPRKILRCVSLQALSCWPADRCRMAGRGRPAVGGAAGLEREPRGEQAARCEPCGSSAPRSPLRRRSSPSSRPPKPPASTRCWFR